LGGRRRVPIRGGEEDGLGTRMRALLGRAGPLSPATQQAVRSDNNSRGQVGDTNLSLRQQVSLRGARHQDSSFKVQSAHIPLTAQEGVPSSRPCLQDWSEYGATMPLVMRSSRNVSRCEPVSSPPRLGGPTHPTQKPQAATARSVQLSTMTSSPPLSRPTSLGRGREAT